MNAANAVRVLLIVATSAWTSATMAQATRTWVSGVGDDVNPCSRTAPCKTFAGAISKTAEPGEINALDPGGYGAVNITKSITIDGGATFASILASAVNGVIIAAGPSDKVVLRNLSINGAGTTLGVRGIWIQSAGEVIIENVTAFNFSTAGIFVAPQVTVQSPVASPVKVFVDGSSLTQNAVGLSVTSAGAGAVATVRLSNSAVTHNTTGLQSIAGGNIVSYNNNRLVGNGTDGAPTQTVYLR